MKKNIKENVAGLEFINKLKTITYTLDISGINERVGANRTNENNLETVDRTALAEKEKVIYSGFIAQDVEKAAKETGYEFSGIDAPKNDNDLYGLRYSDFVVPLVKAVQQLSKENDSLKEQNATLEARLQKIESVLKITPTSNQVLSASSVGQNSPNPFRGNTVISYNIPQGLNTAQIVVYDAAGKALKQISISGQGRGTVNLDATMLPSGTYHYSLYINGNVIDTKKMVLIK